MTPIGVRGSATEGGEHLDLVLRETEQRSRALFKGSPLPSYAWRRVGGDFVLTDYSDAADAFTHGAVARYVGMKATKMYPDRPDIVADLTRCYMERTTIRRAMLYRFRSTGQSRHLSVTYGYVPPDLVLVHTEDLEPRVRAEAAERASGALFSAVFRNAPLPMGLGMMDSGRIVEVNEALCRFFGYDRDKMVGRSVYDLGLWADAADRHRLIRMVREQGAVRDQEIPFRHANGDVRRALVSMELIELAGMDEPVVVTILSDVTAQRLRERQLAEAQQLAHVGSWEWEIGANVVTWSDELYRVYGLDPGSVPMTYESWLARVHPDDRDRARGIVERALRDCRSFQYEHRIVRPDGTVRTLHARGEVVQDASGGAVLMRGTGQDITERKKDDVRRARHAARLLRFSRQLVGAQEAERQRISRELHDEMGQLLTALRFMLDASPVRAARPAVDAPDRRRPSAEKLRSIVDELIERTRMLSVSLCPPLLEQLGLLPTLLWHLDSFGRQTGINVRLEHRGIDGRFPQEVELGAFRVVQEALTNVTRHAGVGDASVRVSAETGLLHVAVEDRGRGFDPAVQRHQVTAGISGMRERARLLGGTLEVTSAPGKGTRVVLRLPVRKDRSPEGP